MHMSFSSCVEGFRDAKGSLNSEGSVVSMSLQNCAYPNPNIYMQLNFSGVFLAAPLSTMVLEAKVPRGAKGQGSGTSR